MGLVSAVKAEVDNLIVQLGSSTHSGSGEMGILLEVLQNSPCIPGVFVPLNNGTTRRGLDHVLKDGIEPCLFP